jgi:methyltransferase (TIGR00027 family)
MTMLQLSERWNPQRDQTAAYMAVRTRFFDDLTMQAVRQGIAQIVIVAAGMDARAFRLDLPPRTQLFELDRKEVLDVKNEILRSEDAQARCQRTAIASDFGDEWDWGLSWAAGFKSAEPSLWIIEGLLYYLTEEDVRRLLTGISGCASSGSMLGADLVSGSYFRSPWTKPALEMMEARGMAWRFGSDDPEGLFAKYGWRARVSQPGDDEANYGRWTFPVIAHDERELPHSFLVRALRD